MTNTATLLLIFEPFLVFTAAAGLWQSSRRYFARTLERLHSQDEQLRNIERQGVLTVEGLAQVTNQHSALLRQTDDMMARVQALHGGNEEITRTVAVQGARTEELLQRMALLADLVAKAAEQSAELQQQAAAGATQLQSLKTANAALTHRIEAQSDQLLEIAEQGRRAIEREERLTKQMSAVSDALAEVMARAQEISARSDEASARLQQAAAQSGELHQELVNRQGVIAAGVEEIRQHTLAIRESAHRSNVVAMDKFKRVEQRIQSLNGHGPVKAVALPGRAQPAWRVESDQGHPLFEIEAMNRSRAGQSIRLDPRLKDGIRLAITDLISRTPELATITSVHGAHWILRFSPEVNRGLSSGLYHIVPSRAGGMRAIVRNSAGQFVGHGSLHSAGGLGAVALAGIGWQIAAVATGMFYMDRIHRQLDLVKKGIDRIEDLMERERMGEARAIEKHLRMIEDHLESSDDVSPEEMQAWVVQLESIELQCQSMLEQAGLGQKSALERVRGLDFGGIWTDKGALVNCQETVRSYRQEAQMFASVAYVSLLLGRVRLLLSNNPKLTDLRFRRMRDELEEGIRMHQKFVGVIQGKLRTLGERPEPEGLFETLLQLANERRSGTAVNGLAEELRKCEKEVGDWLNNLQKGFVEACNAVDNQIKMAQKDTALVVSLNPNGSVQDIQRLEV